MKYIDAEKLIAEIESRMEDCKLPDGKFPTTTSIVRYEELSCLRNFITSLQQKQKEIPPLVCPHCMKSFDDCEDYPAYHNRVRYICPHCGYDGDSTEFETSYNSHPIHKVTHKIPFSMIQWTGHNLKEVIDFTGKSPRFGEWFKSWDEYENYVHSHNDILKLFCEDGSLYEVPVGAWIVKTPDGYNVPSVSRFVQEQPEVDLEKELNKWRHKHFKRKRDDDYSGEYLERESQLDLALHFFELGLNARKV